MRTIIKIKRFFIILGFLIAFTFFIRISFNYCQESNDNFTENNSELKQKVAGYLNVNCIYIDDTDPTRNWSITEAIYDWCTGSGTINDPYIIENVAIDGHNSGNCISVKYSSVFFIIRNCTLYNSGNDYDYAGIKIEYSDNAQIINNTCLSNYHGIFTRKGINYNISNNIVKDNTHDGIVLESFLDNCTIKGNKAINNFQHGIVLRQDCDDIIISDNYVKDHIYSGIIIQGGSDNNKIINNIVIENDGFAGIWIYNSDDNIIKKNNFSSNEGYGIEIEESNNNTVIENKICNNTIYGIEFDTWTSTPATYNTIVNNNITENKQAGIHLDDYSMNNKIFLNNFVDNNINGYDAGTNNQWDNGTIGNYWDDYPGVDANNDGIGDSPYNITGKSNNKDRFPIWKKDILNPLIYINSPSANQIFGTDTPDFSITVDDQSALSGIWYTIDEGMTNFKIIEFASHIIEINDSIDQNAWNNATEGEIVIIFYAQDVAGNIGIRIVTVIKRISVETEISGYNIFVLIGLASVISVFLVRKHKHK